MTDHSTWVNVAINIGCVVVSIKLVNYLGYKKGMSVNLASSLAFSGMMLLFYLCAKFFHISFLLIPVNGGIPWSKPNGFLLMLFLGLIAAVVFCINDYLVNKNKNR